MTETTRPDFINRLIAGSRIFRTQHYELHPEQFAPLKDGQAPPALIISCSDSRIDPALVLQTRPGDLFLVRNVANLVPRYNPANIDSTSAAVEYAVRDLGVSHIIVLGHAKCGGIKALGLSMQSQPMQRDFIGPWVEIADMACWHYLKANHSEDREHIDQTQLEQWSIRNSLDNLRTFPWLAERVAAGNLSLHGWWFDLDHGQLWGLDSEGKDFVRLAAG